MSSTDSDSLWKNAKMVMDRSPQRFGAMNLSLMGRDYLRCLSGKFGEFYVNKLSRKPQRMDICWHLVLSTYLCNVCC